MQAKLEELKKEIEQLSLLKSQVSFDNNRLIIILETDSQNKNLLDKLKARIEQLAKEKYHFSNSSVVFTNKLEISSNKKNIEGVKKIIAVASGKGGVGKSSVAANLAVVLAKQAYRVGLADLDIHGPSIAKIFGLNKKPEIKENKIIPFIKYGVKVLSMAMLVDEGSALIWRGPMVSKAVSQLMIQANWDDCDYLILDLPPGTGDIHLTVFSTYNITGTVLVSTPQQVALIDVKRALEMLRKLEVPVLGVIENMSFFEGSGKKLFPFGNGNVQAFCKKEGVAFFGEIPLITEISELQDSGIPYCYKRNNKEVEGVLLKIC